MRDHSIFHMYKITHSLILYQEIISSGPTLLWAMVEIRFGLLSQTNYWNHIWLLKLALKAKHLVSTSIFKNSASYMIIFLPTGQTPSVMPIYTLRIFPHKISKALKFLDV